MTSHTKDMDRLFRQEYGSIVEFVIRISGIALGALVLFDYSGQSYAIWWLAAYVGLQVVNFNFLLAFRRRATRWTVLVGVVLNFSLLVVFSTAPTYLLMQDDIALRYAAATALFCLTVYMLWRTDDQALSVALKFVLAAAILGLTLHEYLPRQDAWYGQLTMVIIGAAGLGYFILALISKRLMRRIHSQAETRMLHAQKMEAVGQLSGGIAHDFNNILTAIQGNLELYHLSTDEADKTALVENAQVAANRASALVRHLLAYSRSTPMMRKQVLIDQVFDDLDSLTRRLIPATIDLTFSNDRADLSAYVDEDQLITAIVNLVLNARDAIDGTGRIEISAQRTNVTNVQAQHIVGSDMAPGPYVAIVVRDTGAGIPNEDIGRVTEPFYTTKPVGEGSGLGLSMVSGFAAQSGGGISIVSSADGTAVTIYLPPEAET